MPGWGGDGDSVGVGRGDAGNEGAEIHGEIVDFETELIKGVVDILKTRFDDVGSGIKLTRSVLADSIGKRIVSRVFLTGSHVKVAPVNIVRRGRKMLSKGFDGKN